LANCGLKQIVEVVSEYGEDSRDQPTRLTILRPNHPGNCWVDLGPVQGPLEQGLLQMVEQPFAESLSHGFAGFSQRSGSVLSNVLALASDVRERAAGVLQPGSSLRRRRTQPGLKSLLPVCVVPEEDVPLYLNHPAVIGAPDFGQLPAVFGRPVTEGVVDQAGR